MTRDESFPVAHRIKFPGAPPNTARHAGACIMQSPRRRMRPEALSYPVPGSSIRWIPSDCPACCWQSRNRHPPEALSVAAAAVQRAGTARARKGNARRECGARVPLGHRIAESHFLALASFGTGARPEAMDFLSDSAPHTSVQRDCDAPSQREPANQSMAA